MSEVLPLFAHISNREAAEALSELGLRGPDFRVTTKYTRHDELVSSSTPPFISAIGLTYLKGPEGDATASDFVVMPTDGRDASTIAKIYLDGYRDLVVPYHESADHITNDLSIEVDKMAIRAIKSARAANLRTVVAFSVFSVIGSDEDYCGLLAPINLHTDLSLEVRQHLLKEINSGNSEIKSLEEKLGDLTEAKEVLLQNDPHMSGELATLSAALNLPRIDLMARTLNILTLPTNFN